LENFARDGIEVVSSNPLAEASGANGSQVRKDLAYFGEFGVRGVGYNVKWLIHAITQSLGVNREWKMALVGVGNLGRALLNHSEFRSRGFNIVAIFDCDPFKIGEIMHGMEVICTDNMKDMASDLGLEMGMITTPPERAQRAADNLFNAGIFSIINFAPARIKAPAHAHIEYVDFFRHLYALAFEASKTAD
ncbi:MAG: redox-sensing transcriptional repressor Rex, partial [Desulfovibrio sp.]|nr:redox-sensing transcriptional repressor Rex [Desulfovibrio sp.]